ncbi:aminotransferase [Amphiplicatus metriothermophilus]|uniref:Aminotransferase n=1 Tax=Amphiplicatus metriothermophilus TaxID=1519374 RepID=A0A239PZ63_9PROT|nr:aminotransferase [Amphiplicatus metriothermophilus]MBB5518198.1 aspartate/methionine/tyrosine aminotransferase [Amphiplicatus metriothermophilus]SNT75368.1 Aspartate/methionine/tyrosine aminotransferase [Amphiplicatus metriothermophilus]
MPRSLNPVFAERPVTIFAVMSALANEHGAINLGQGFPDEDGPRALLDAAARFVVEGPNQYAPVTGIPELRQAVARANGRFYGLDVDWERETLVVSGATEGLAASFLAFLQPGDEAIVLAPFYDSYAPMIEAAGARARPINLEPPDWRLAEEALAAAITPKTKLIAVNSPHNPTGKVLADDELALIADVCRAHDLIAVCDEVYEHLIFDGRPHRPLMTLPGMRERTVRIGSAGKTFSLTGWRIGYATGPEHLIAGLVKAHQFVAYTTPAHLQRAVALGLDFGDDYYERFVAEMQQKRDRMRAGLEAAGFDVLPCEGTYFMTVDIRSVGYDGDDMAFCREITQKAKVAAVPVSSFYHPAAPGPRRYARFCFCKKDDVLEEAARRLKSYFG